MKTTKKKKETEKSIQFVEHIHNGCEVQTLGKHLGILFKLTTIYRERSHEEYTFYRRLRLS